MRRHKKNTRTLYEYAISNGTETAFTLWFTSRNPTMNKIYKAIQGSCEAIKKNTHTTGIMWNGDGTITAGKYTGKMTGRTMLEARGYHE